MKLNIVTLGKLAIIGAVGSLAILALAVSPLFAVSPTPTPAKPSGPTPGTTITHEQMDKMMDAMHGEGTSQRMHEVMGPDAEKVMDQCVDMMNMMQNMQGMMGGGPSGRMGGGTSGTAGSGPSGMTGGTSGMMSGQNGQSIQDMMSRMMGQ